MEAEIRSPDERTFLRGLADAGVLIESLRRSTCQLVLFGSRAAKVAGPRSDWDLLCIGRPTAAQEHVGQVDLLWIDERSLASQKWLESELAGHVARYGVWLHGEPDWVSAVRCGAAAAERKARRISSRLRALERAWGLLSTAHRAECATLLRRDVQRHELLRRGEPVPPSRFLDDAWSARAPATEPSLDYLQSLVA